MRIYVAIVCKSIQDSDLTKRSAFSGTDRDQLIRTAITEREIWHKRGHGPYRIFVGELTREIVSPVTWVEESI